MSKRIVIPDDDQDATRMRNGYELDPGQGFDQVVAFARGEPMNVVMGAA